MNKDLIIKLLSFLCDDKEPEETKAKNTKMNYSIYDDYINQMVLVRSYSAGVFYGKLKQIDDTTLILDDCRRIWYWEGANSLTDVAISGVKSSSKITQKTQNHLVKTYIEIVKLTDKALSNLDKIQDWTYNE